jgi:hypothetical protein
MCISSIGQQINEKEVVDIANPSVHPWLSAVDAEQGGKIFKTISKNRRET